MTKISKRRLKGQAFTEYLIAAIFLTFIVWYALVGGSVEADGSGGLWETDADHKGTGLFLDTRHGNNDTPMPGVAQALHKKQEDFVQSIYQP